MLNLPTHSHIGGKSCPHCQGLLLQAGLEEKLAQQLAGGSSEHLKVWQNLLDRAGGAMNVMGAAFGDRLLVNPGLESSTSAYFDRRKFLQHLLLGAMVTTLSNCSGLENRPESSSSEVPTTRLEKTHLKIAFLPITCATPIIMAQPLGFYEKYGLTVELIKMNSWGQVRDAAIAGELDAYHMLSPMPLAMSLGLDSVPSAIKLASIENINGNAITVASRHRATVKGPSNFKGFRIAIPFVYSMHNLLLRYYLAVGGLHPDRDVELVILPPAEMLRGLQEGTIDAMIVAEPFNQQAVEQGIGFIHLLTQELWPGHPCCSFTTSEAWIDQYPNTFRALNKAIIDSANYARQAYKRQEIAQAIASPEYINANPETLEAVLTGNFDDGLGRRRNIPDRIDFDPYPWKSFSYWITTQFQRWGLLTENNFQHEAIADRVFMTGLARQLSKQLGQTPPTLILRYENLKFGRFDPTEPNLYLQQQIAQYKF
jgi:nitrate/nitrite transport system substrate-binding protein